MRLPPILTARWRDAWGIARLQRRACKGSERALRKLHAIARDTRDDERKALARNAIGAHAMASLEIWGKRRSRARRRRLLFQRIFGVNNV